MATVRVRRASDLGPALRDVRTAEAITQSALANLAGVGRQWLNAFEMGDKPTAPIDMVMRVAAALGVSINLDASPNASGKATALVPSHATETGLAPTAAEQEEVVDLDALLDDLS
ncbi:helix-turn-helix domain-containing protein [Nocardioides sp.]|uniref:helix-turn-helix domain-containing protein n=1 Tax=Nocardioides sp. TaxID=35761 RepID=UPI003512C7A6